MYVRLAHGPQLRTFPRVTPPMTTRPGRETPNAVERRAVQDALAWPIAITLLVSAATIFFLPRFVQSRFVPIAAGLAFALTTMGLVALLGRTVERWLKRHAAALAAGAERQVEAVGLTGLPTATGDHALVPLASAYADAGARVALRAAERDAREEIAAFGEGAAQAVGRTVARLRLSIDNPVQASADALRDALTELEQLSLGFRHVTAAVPDPAAPIDLVAELRAVAGALAAETGGASVTTVFDTDRGNVLIDRETFRRAAHDLLMMARQLSPADGVVTLHVARLFRANIEETPVRRTGDSRLTIVPRAPADVLRAWVQRSQPGAEVLSIVVSDGRAPRTDDTTARPFAPFADPSPGDPLGITLPAIRRAVVAARGTIWIDGAREGGVAVRILLPIVTGDPARIQ